MTTTTAQGRVLYDGECSLCISAARRCEGLLRRTGFELAALQTTNMGAPFDVDEQGRPREMMVMLPDGRALAAPTVSCKLRVASGGHGRCSRWRRYR